ncbi:MAG: hypothetical protein DRN61_05760 [Thaumarchaeota archaeon]|nr:MAG: hypothetical protein DRN61_05760 [Nitrososphaerota archaeon]
MGGGLKREAYNQRFSLAEPIKESSCIERTAEDILRIGSYTIQKTPQGWQLTKNGKTLGTYPKAIIKEGRVLLSMGKGMLLEVTPQGHREVLSIHKARLIAGVCGDGSITRSSRCHELKFINTDDKLLEMYFEALKKVYGIDQPYVAIDHRKHKPVIHVHVGKSAIVEDVYKYCKKEGVEYWRVPLKYLDPEAAIEFINFYFSCDGSFDHRPQKGTREIIFKSCSRDALQDIKCLLESYFDVRSHFRAPEYDKEGRRRYHKLVISGCENLRKLFLHGFTSYRSNHQKIIDELRRWALGESHGL